MGLSPKILRPSLFQCTNLGELTQCLRRGRFTPKGGSRHEHRHEETAREERATRPRPTNQTTSLSTLRSTGSGRWSRAKRLALCRRGIYVEEGPHHCRLIFTLRGRSERKAVRCRLKSLSLFCLSSKSRTITLVTLPTLVRSSKPDVNPRSKRKEQIYEQSPPPTLAR